MDAPLDDLTSPATTAATTSRGKKRRRDSTTKQQTTSRAALSQETFRASPGPLEERSGYQSPESSDTSPSTAAATLQRSGTLTARRQLSSQSSSSHRRPQYQLLSGGTTTNTHGTSQVSPGFIYVNLLCSCGRSLETAAVIIPSPAPPLSYFSRLMLRFQSVGWSMC